jgi:hypothetical protein
MIRLTKSQNVFTQLALWASCALLFVLFFSSTTSVESNISQNMLDYVYLYEHISKVNNISSHKATFLANTILNTSKRLLGQDYRVGICIIQTESHFRINAIGDDGVSRGLSQIKLSAAKDACKYLGLPNCSQRHLKYLISVPRYNILLGMGYLSFLLHTYNDLDKAIQAYNLGMGRINSGLPNYDYLYKVKQNCTFNKADIKKT